MIFGGWLLLPGDEVQSWSYWSCSSSEDALAKGGLRRQAYIVVEVNSTMVVVGLGLGNALKAEGRAGLVDSRFAEACFRGRD